MNVSLVLPQHLVPDTTNLKECVLDAAQQALIAGMDPVFVEGATENHNIKTYLSQITLATFVSRPSHLSLSKFIAGLAISWFMSQQKQSRVGAQSPKASPGLRPEQQHLIELAETGIEKGMIVFSEAGTGVGKTRAALAMAARYADQTGQPTVYAVPTLAVLGQAVKEYSEMSPEDMGLVRRPRFAFLIGKGSFINPALLRDMLEKPDDLKDCDIDLARVWMEKGGPTTPGAKTAHLHDAAPGLAWLVEDLQHAAPGFPADVARLVDDAEEDCPAQQLYDQLRRDVLESEIVVCTHAMLGLSIIRMRSTPEEIRNRLNTLDTQIERAKEKNKQIMLQKLRDDRRRTKKFLAEIEDEPIQQERSSILPAFKLLLIDEAHLFEAAIANLKSSEVNPRLLVNNIREHLPDFAACRSKSTAQTIITIMESLHTKMVTIGQTIKDDRILLNGQSAKVDKAVSNLIAPFLESIHNLNLTNTIQKCPAVRNVISPLQTLTRNYMKGGDGVWLNLSPRRRYPSLTTGPRNINSILERIWNRVDSAVLMSATLALPDKTGLPKVTFFAQSLAVPSKRIYVTQPIVQPWLYDARLNETGKGKIQLTPPSEVTHEVRGQTRDKKEALQWASAVAIEIQEVASTALGGTLVLTSSYDRVRFIANALVDLNLQARLVVQDRKKGVRAAQSAFEAKGHIRPIWIATGPAWTGVDIRAPIGVEPQDDNLLTDLVLVNIPFGTNRSTTHIARTEWDKAAERDRAALEFKQGIGRLIRRGGLQNRRLHILDSRIWNPIGYYSPFRKIIENYHR